jgi:hypothetical protein
MSNNIAPKRNASPAAIATLIVVVLGVAALGALSVYTDLLWYGQLGFDKVFTTQIFGTGKQILPGSEKRKALKQSFVRAFPFII